MPGSAEVRAWRDGRPSTGQVIRVSDPKPTNEQLAAKLEEVLRRLADLERAHNQLVAELREVVERIK
jgi:hypothetical protein